MTEHPRAERANVPDVDVALLRKHDVSGPRYTSYPTAPQFADTFGPDDHAEALTASATAIDGAPSPLSVYVHLPFCQELCWFCGCNMRVSHDREGGTDRYLDHVLAEMDAVATRARGGADAPRRVEQLHWGGGTPTFLLPRQIERLTVALKERFDFADDAEVSLEVDPRDCSDEQVALLGRLGFNRISMGVQDFEPEVQKAINRIQSEEDTRRVVDGARAAGMTSVNLDLIYGLPFQTPERFAETLEKTLTMAPDRLAIFNFAYLPDMIKHQKVIPADALPSPDDKIAILRDTIGRLGEAGYVFIGMDHFAKPDDELAVAQREGVLHRNFQGYTTRGHCDLAGLGVSAISQVGPTYSQNVKVLNDYQATVEPGDRLATMRGVRLTRDDEIRRAAIMQLICNLELDIPAFEASWSMSFDERFGDALTALAPLADDGLVSVEPGKRITVSEVGRLFIRNICMPFDAYLKKGPARFSRTV